METDELDDVRKCTCNGDPQCMPCDYCYDEPDESDDKMPDYLPIGDERYDFSFDELIGERDNDR